MKFIKIIAQDNLIPTSFLNGLAKDMAHLAKFAEDMKDAGVKLSIENKNKIEEAMYVISKKIEEINKNII